MSFALKYNFAQVARESGFQLRSYKDGHLDWRLVGSVEIERVLREQNLEQVDAVLDHLSELPLGSLLETNILDTGIAKYFLLSQFAIQYLLFCRKFLVETVADLREAHGSAQMEIAKLKRSLSEANGEILQLHKKVTQMEAIHEVIYPCHLCTKNFVSNDALNLHISRKHSGADYNTNKHEVGRAETPVTAGKERENDMNLINAIKLELEVKHLKERLNNAERKIKEASSNDVPNNDTTKSCCCDKHENAVKCSSIGIQSNLSELKENDELMDGNNSNSNPRYDSSEQISVLQDNLQELNQWKKEQQLENLAFLADIENKFKDLTQALETTKNQQNCKLQSNEHAHEHEHEHSPTTSRQDLEIFLNQKLEDIVKTSGAKMDEVINQMELNYSSKLDKLENQLLKLIKQADVIEPIREVREVKGAVVVQEKPKYISVKDVDKVENKTKSLEIVVGDNSLRSGNENKTQLDEELAQQGASSEHSSSPSNNTYVKSNSLKYESEDSTEISDGFQDDEGDADESNVSKTKNPPKLKIVRQRPVQKPVTRKFINKLTDSRLMALGIDMKAKSLTPTTMQHISEELNKRRNVLKNKHPNFYATRNKIKKFVDKLCSSKMPENAGKLLKATREPENKRYPTKNEDTQSLSTSDDDSEQMSLQAKNVSTPKNGIKSTNKSIDFKQRLENILASPIKKPEEDHYTYTTTRQQKQRTTIEDKPIPMPRKRVMFNQENL